MNDTQIVTDENTVMSYVDPDDGKTYYSFDGGLTFEALTAAEYEEGFVTRGPTRNIRNGWTTKKYSFKA